MSAAPAGTRSNANAPPAWGSQCSADPWRTRLYFSNGEQLWFCSAPKIELVSSACAGDAALGAFLSRWLNAGDIPQALALASATGADVAASAGLGKLNRTQELLQQLQIVQL
jgi:6-phosphofructokinase 2